MISCIEMRGPGGDRRGRGAGRDYPCVATIAEELRSGFQFIMRSQTTRRKRTKNGIPKLPKYFIRSHKKGKNFSIFNEDFPLHSTSLLLPPSLTHTHTNIHTQSHMREIDRHYLSSKFPAGNENPKERCEKEKERERESSIELNTTVRLN